MAEEQTVAEFEVSNDESFRLLNEVFKKNLSKIEARVKEFFGDLKSTKEKVLVDSFEASRFKYQEIITQFEKNLELIYQEVEKVDPSNQDEVRKLKLKVKESEKSIENETEVKKLFLEVLNRLNYKLEQLTIQNLSNPDFKFTLSGKHEDNNWKGLNSNIIINKKSNSGLYKCFFSSDIFDHEVNCQIHLKKFNSQKGSDHWNYVFGVLVGDNIKNHDTFYKNSAVLLSTGYLAVQNSNTVDKEKKITEQWKEGDLITVIKNSDGDVYFQYNEGEKVLAFKGIIDVVQIVFAIGSNLVDDEIEMVHISSRADIQK